MIKKFTSIALCAALSLGTIAASAKTIQFTMNSTGVDVLEDGVQSIEILTAPYTKNDRTMVPVRFVSENFGANVSWDEPTLTATIKKDDNTINLVINSDTANVNGADITLDAAPEQVNDVTMIPLRFVTESLGYNVKYSDITDQVLITDEKPIMTVNGQSVLPCEFDALYKINLVQYGDDYSSQIIDTMYPVFKSNYALASSVDEIAEKDGVMITAQEKIQIKDSLPTYLENCETKVLSGAIAMLISNMNLSNYYQQYIYSNEMKNVSDEDITKTYNDSYVCAKHILVSNTNEKAENIIKEIQTKLKKKADFDKLVEEYGEDPGMESNPDGYVFTAGEMVKEFEDAAFALEVDKVSDVVETSYGYHIIKRLALPDLTDELKQNIRSLAAQNKTYTVLDEIVEKAEITDNYTSEELKALLN